MKKIFILLLFSIQLFASNRQNQKLMFAIQAENLKAAKKAIKNGANVNGFDEEWPFFISVISSGNIKLFKLFLKYNANLNIKGPDGKTPLIHAIITKNKTMIKLLLKKGANIFASDNNNKTVLMYASQYGDKNLIKKLLKKGANTKKKDKNNKTAIDYAIKARNTETLHILSKLNTLPIDFINAVKNKNPQKIQKLLKSGANIMTKDNFGKPAPVIAVIQNDIPTMQALLNNGLNPNIKIFKKATLLDFAFKLKHLGIAEILLKYGATGNFNLKFKNKTPLMIAIKNKRNSLIKLILKQKQDINIVDDYGQTALIYAVNNNNFQTVKTLLKKGADTTIREYQGKTALDLAKEKKLTTIISILKEKE